MDGAIEEQVRQRAYEIWMALGKTDGQAQDHWFAAEQDVMRPAAKPKKARVAAPRKKAAVKTEAEEKMSRSKSAKVSKTRN